jgi:hypothetical protein
MSANSSIGRAPSRGPLGIGVYFLHSSVQVQPERSASALSTEPEVSELARLVEELQEWEFRLHSGGRCRRQGQRSASSPASSIRGGAART